MSHGPDARARSAGQPPGAAGEPSGEAPGEISGEASGEAESPPLTEDALLGGSIRYRQPARGYRVGLEAPLLAAFALRPGRRPPGTIADLGAGPGAVGLCLAASLPAAAVTLIEPAPLHARLARENAALNGWAGRVAVVEHGAAGVDAVVGRGAFDLVVTNPPWFEQESGPGADGELRQGSRTLVPGELRAFLAAARQLVGRGGRLCICFPVATMPSLLAELARLGMPPKRLRPLHPRATQPANAVFVEALAGKPGGLVLEPPWFVREAGQEYTAEIRGLLWGK
jgi:tRNA1Val (adenine37-N6)-methyltransferase